MMKSNGSSVLIVGASRGIGLEFVRQFLAAGAAVTATARSADGLAQLQALGARALQLDVTDAASVSAIAWPTGGGFDTVVVNAGLYGPQQQAALQPPSGADFDAVMHTNVLGPMRVIPQLVGALKPSATVAVVSSLMGSIGGRSNGNAWLYRASKAALNSVLKDVSFALQGKAVCVALHPGWVRTDMGGSEADLDVADSVAGLRRTLAALTPPDNGSFFNHDGSRLPW